ncbi:WD domain, G-beta repeat-containing protein [Acanthamoeba castellanii str. Neff]|uniref:WD domain, G-beta repeat-containing protein n=1 Tax=Acanthamoeba castellanii (strain ATCC 30010 / Neff) TaxID=1257118 RepID=L8GJ50_ACACF|nr:WD domain, G-beta repeat-containing protein [Acanthamoeba castellanii str. Neff]ELR12783.1 WD domain, G-beta repeat-containing protein [Acanthamoeba castellanii str. Neff]
MRCGQREEFQSLLARGTHNINRRDDDDMLIHWASMWGHADIVRTLLDQGALVNAPATALHYACEKGHTDVAQVLLDFGANVNAQTRGETPIELARRRNNTKTVELLEDRIKQEQERKKQELEEKDLQGRIFEFSQTVAWTHKQTAPSAVQCLLRVDDTVWSGGADGNIGVWNAQTGLQVTGIKTSDKRGRMQAMILVDNTVWTTSDEMGGEPTIRVWNSKSLVKITELTGAHTKVIRCLALVISRSPAVQVWSGDLSGVITVWNAQRLKKESEIHLPETGVYSMRQVGSHVWIGGDSHIICYNLKSGDMFTVNNAHARPVNDISLEGDYVWTSSNDHTVKVWRPGATLSDIVRIKEINLDSNVLCLSRISHYNAAQQVLNVYMSGGQTDGTVALWDTRKHSEVERFGAEKNQGTIRCMLWVAENNTLWCGSRDRNIYLWTLKD